MKSNFVKIVMGLSLVLGLNAQVAKADAYTSAAIVLQKVVLYGCSNGLTPATCNRYKLMEYTVRQNALYKHLAGPRERSLFLVQVNQYVAAVKYATANKL